MLRNSTVLSFFFFLSAYASTQQLLPGRFTPTSVDVSPTTAAQNSVSINTKFGGVNHPVASLKARFERKPGDRDARVWRITMPDGWTLVDSRTGVVILYENAKRQDDRYRGKGRTGKKFTTSELTAKAHLRSLATKIGIPTSAQMSGFKMVGDGVGQDSNPMGHFGCVFKDSAGRVVATLACDIQDGVVLEFSRQ